MKKWADRKWLFREFKEKDQVLVKLYQYEHIREVHKELMCQYEGSFTMFKKIGNIAYKV